jgi:hypothetical protein
VRAVVVVNARVVLRKGLRGDDRVRRKDMCLP